MVVHLSFFFPKLIRIETNEEHTSEICHEETSTRSTIKCNHMHQHLMLRLVTTLGLCFVMRVGIIIGVHVKCAVISEYPSST